MAQLLRVEPPPAAAFDPAALVAVHDLRKYFPVGRGWLGSKAAVKAVDGVSLTVRPGETLGLVGESGCGKTTLGRLVLRLIEPTAGTVLYRGRNILAAGPTEMRRLRRHMQIVFQDPYSSLNPRLTVRQILGEAVSVAAPASRAEGARRLDELMTAVGLPSRYLDRYPRAFSGGQRQRIVIARALAVEPEFLVCDEPVSALDVSIQSQILNLFRQMQTQLNLAYLFISHDLSVVRYMSHRVAVMYLGQVIETAPRDALFSDPLHPYTRALLSAIPVPNPRVRRERIILAGEVPSPLRPPSGCRFHPRCPQAMPQCKEVPPTLQPVPSTQAAEGGSSRWVACHLYD